jgi:hypothetical protein
MYIKETVFLNHDNPMDLRLMSAGVAIDHTTITRAKVVLDATHIIDSQSNAGAFDFTNPAKLIIKLGMLGGVAVPVGTYTANLIIYTSAYPNGIVWEPSIDIAVVSF